MLLYNKQSHRWGGGIWYGIKGIKIRLSKFCYDSMVIFELIVVRTTTDLCLCMWYDGSSRSGNTKSLRLVKSFRLLQKHEIRDMTFNIVDEGDDEFIDKPRNVISRSWSEIHLFTTLASESYERKSKISFNKKFIICQQTKKNSN